MNARARIGLLGGTLDPVHVGHVETALAARRALNLDRVDVLPSHAPPHRAQQPVASGYHRFAMTALAVNGIDGLAASDVELRAPGPSYTADTLVRFRETSGLGAAQIFFITGADAFAEIATWSRYPAILDLAHFTVVARPGITLDSLQQRAPDLAERMTTPATFRPQASGLEPRDKTRIILIETATPDVSSTEIRRRVTDGESLAGLVPDSVAAYIYQHRLYLGAGL